MEMRRANEGGSLVGRKMEGWGRMKLSSGAARRTLECILSEVEKVLSIGGL